MATVTKPTVNAEQMIRVLAQDFVKHYNERNIDKLVTLFANDGRLFGPFHPMVEGPKGLRKHFEQTFKEYDPRNLTVVTTHVEVCGEIAFCLGSAEMNLRIPSGRRLDDLGNWIVALRRVGMDWRIVAHCYNTALPITTLAA
jgi:ketosteroid isomerase-like protein